jgi:hypothetical protein
MIPADITISARIAAIHKITAIFMMFRAVAMEEVSGGL